MRGRGARDGLADRAGVGVAAKRSQPFIACASRDRTLIEARHGPKQIMSSFDSNQACPVSAF
jgi:hypothetical protein